MSKLAEALATLSEVLSYFPKNAGLRAVTPDDAAHVRRVTLDHMPTVADVYRWRQTLEELFK